MGSGDLELNVQDSGTCAGCTIVLGDNISTASTMTRKMFPTQQKMWDPSDDPNDFGGSQMINRRTHGGLTKVFLTFPSIPFTLNLSVTIEASKATLPLASGSITQMSVFHPFPLRIEGQQYDACFQIGEFGSRNKGRLPPPFQHVVYDLGPLVRGSGVVVLIPLATGSDVSGPGARFVNSFARLMPSAVNNVSIPSLKIGDILDVSQPFYTWKNTDGTRVIVMKDPVSISASDMASIRRSIPATPPADVIHEIQSAQYKPAPPPPKPPARRILQPPVDLTIIGESKRGLFIEVLKTTGYVVAAFFVIWLAIKFAKSDTGRNVVEGIGGGLAGLWRGIRGAPARVGQGIRSGAAAAGSAASAAGSVIGSAASAAGQGIRSDIAAAGSAASAAGSAIGSAASAAGQGIRWGVGAAGSAIGSAGQGIRSVAARGLAGAAPSSDAKEPSAAARVAKEAAAARAARDAEQAAAAGVGPLNPAPPSPGETTWFTNPGFTKPLPRATGPARPNRNVVAEPADGEEDTSGEAEQAKEESKRKAAAAKPSTLRRVQNATGPLGSAVRQQRNLGRGQLTGEPALQARGLTGRPRGGRRRRRMKTGRRI